MVRHLVVSRRIAPPVDTKRLEPFFDAFLVRFFGAFFDRREDFGGVDGFVVLDEPLSLVSNRGEPIVLRLRGEDAKEVLVVKVTHLLEYLGCVGRRQEHVLGLQVEREIVAQVDLGGPSFHARWGLGASLAEALGSGVGAAWVPSS